MSQPQLYKYMYLLEIENNNIVDYEIIPTYEYYVQMFMKAMDEEHNLHLFPLFAKILEFDVKCVRNKHEFKVIGLDDRLDKKELQELLNSNKF